MQLQTNLVRRQSRFYFRSRVPTDLKSHYGKTEILMSLKTSDKRVADYELAKFKVKLYAEFAQIRGDVFDFELKLRIPVKSATQTTGKLPPPPKVIRSEATRVFLFTLFHYLSSNWSVFFLMILLSN